MVTRHVVNCAKQNNVLCYRQNLKSCGEGSRSRCYGHTAALRLIVQSCDEDDWVFLFFRVMEHRWN
jgi:hypothetical protein